jgi:predicted enzyme related to lactoylglutathione lyase
MSDNPVVHFEMPYEDAERVANFYKTAFGWNMTSYGEDMGNYVLATTTDVDENNMPTTPGGINGGFYPLSDAPEHKEPSFVIAVDDLDKAITDIKAAGGSILREPEEIPGIGMWASFRDSEGNRVSVMKPNPRAAQDAGN